MTHFLNTQILKKYSSFYVLLFDSGPLLNRLISNGENQRKKEIYQENDHFLNTQILKKYSSFYVLLFDSGPQVLKLNILIT